MQESIILKGEKLKEFCKELNIDYNPSKILIKITDDRSEYYNFDDDCFYKLDIEKAKKFKN